MDRGLKKRKKFMRVKNYGNWVSYSGMKGIPGFYEGGKKLFLPVMGGEFSYEKSYGLKQAEAGEVKFLYISETEDSDSESSDDEGFIFIVPAGEGWLGSVGVVLRQKSDKNMIIVVPNSGHVDVREADKIVRYTAKDSYYFSEQEYAIRQTLDFIESMRGRDSD